jgi:5-methylcytosine-specific restriction endonuclease McrA
MGRVDPFWIALFALLIIYKIYSWNQSNKIRNEYDRVRKLRNSYKESAMKEHPELTNKYWNPNRKPVPRDLRPTILARAEGCCFYCNKDLKGKQDWQVDHIWPYRFGGSEELVNLVPSCRNCNEEKWSHLPPRFFLHKWVVGVPFTQHELGFIEFYKDRSMAELIGTSAYWKGQANYWLDHVYKEFADLIISNESLRNSTGKRREELLAMSYSVYKMLDCDHAASKSANSRIIEKWLDDEVMFEEIKRDLGRDF